MSKWQLVKLIFGSIGICLLSSMIVVFISTVPKYISGEVDVKNVSWFALISIIIGCLAAILIGFNVIKTERIETFIKNLVTSVKDMFVVKNKTWKDNLKQGLRAFALGLPFFLFGAFLCILLIATGDELDFTDPFILGGAAFALVLFVMGLMLLPLSVKIWVITIRRYRGGDESFNDQKWSETELINDMISGKS